MSAISKPTAGTGTGGLTLAQLQAEAINQGELDTSLSAISQAVATLGSQLQSAGAVPGELRVFNTDVAPAGWVEKDRNGASPLAVTYGRRSIMCYPRAYTTQTGDTQSATVAGEYNGFAYYLYTVSGSSWSTVYVEKLEVATGRTSYVAMSPLNNYSSAVGTFCPSSAIVGNYLYMFGGRTYSNYAQQTTYRINLDNVSAGWATVDSMTSVNAAHGMGIAVTGGKIYALGGIAGDLTAAATCSHIRVFNTATMAWTKLSATIPFGPVENCHVVALADGNLLCVGGYTGSAESRKFATFYTATGTFGPVGDLPAAWLDRPRALLRCAGHTIARGLCFTDTVNCTVVEFDGNTWINTGVPAAFFNCVMGNIGLSDGSSFMPATLTTYKHPHVQHAHPLGSSARMLCAKL